MTSTGQFIQCLIVDDEPPAIQVLSDYIEQIPNFRLIGSCNSAMEAFSLIQKHEIDLLFLDIHMPGMTGLEFLKSLQQKPAVILTTAHREYALESYEVNAIDYLLKPIDFGRFFKAINKYLSINQMAVASSPKPESYSSSKQGSMYIYVDRKNVKVYLNQIQYIESLKDYVKIVTDQQSLVTKDSISRFESILPKNFIRIHRSFIVNLDRITAYTKHDVEISSKEIPIGASYKKSVLERLKG